MRATWPGARSSRKRMTTSPVWPSPASRVNVRVCAAIGFSCALRGGDRARPLAFQPMKPRPRTMADERLLDDDLRAGDEPGRPDDRVDDERHDEDNRLKPSFVKSV